MTLEKNIAAVFQSLVSSFFNYFQSQCFDINWNYKLFIFIINCDFKSEPMVVVKNEAIISNHFIIMS